MNISSTFIETAARWSGGPVSVKDAFTLGITVAGTVFSELHRDSFTLIPGTKLKSALERDDPISALRGEIAPSGHHPPGIETLIHYTIPHRYLVQLQTTLVSGLVAGKDGKKAAHTLFGDDMVWIPVTPPDNRLLRAVQDAVQHEDAKPTRRPFLFLMQNHGMLVGGDSPEEVTRRCEEAEAAIGGALVRTPNLSPMQKDSDGLIELNDTVRRAFAETRAAHGVALSPPLATACVNPEIAGRIASAAAFTPLEAAFLRDHLVHLGRNLCYVPRHNDLMAPPALQADVLHAVHDFQSLHDAAPRVVAVEQMGAVIVGEDEAELAVCCSAFESALEIACYAESFGGVQPLSAEYIDALIEIHREYGLFILPAG